MAYKEKMKELSMLSLICSHFYPEPPIINIYTYDDMEVKQINKHASGQASELILKPPSPIRNPSNFSFSKEERPVPEGDPEKNWRLQRKEQRLRRPRC
ncbi:Stathmin-2 [Sciurus carolinensis]|uniref:Stathmin-2 n=1 Tax=Sciurus carolinensis TaxID=30640 RepID=A0AA41MWG5_SCICA|nr:Stathmin-2 [Sciurus carolinensis]